MSEWANRRFWLFAGENYYPGGGMEDFISSHDTADEAMAEGARYIGTHPHDDPWAHVLDAETGKVQRIKVSE